MMKPAIVLCPSVVKQQQDEIANVSKAAFVAGKWVLAAACSNRQYAKLAGVATDSRVALETTVARAVRANYEFLTQEFANIVEGNTSIQTTFSDRVLIIDEAHHLRANDTDKNVTRPSAVRMCSNVKVLSLTATPMYDRAAEIVPLINLLQHERR
jgi:superfamily II DNA or RNA helicase